MRPLSNLIPAPLPLHSSAPATFLLFRVKASMFRPQGFLHPPLLSSLMINSYIIYRFVDLSITDHWVFSKTPVVGTDTSFKIKETKSGLTKISCSRSHTFPHSYVRLLKKKNILETLFCARHWERYVMVLKRQKRKKSLPSWSLQIRRTGEIETQSSIIQGKNSNCYT